MRQLYTRIVMKKIVTNPECVLSVCQRVRDSINKRFEADSISFEPRNEVAELVITGWKNEVENFVANLNIDGPQIEDCSQPRNSMAIEDLVFPSDPTKMLKFNSCITILRRRFPKIEISIIDHIIRLCGLPEMTAEAKEYYSNIQITSLGSEMAAELLRREKMNSYIMDEFRASQLGAIVGVEDSKVIICAFHSELKFAVSIVDESYRETDITLEYEGAQIFSHESWIKLKKKLSNDFVLIHEDILNNLIRVIAKSDKLDNVVDQIRLYLDDWIVQRVFLPCQHQAVMVITKSQPEKDISDRFQAKITPTENGFCIEAKKYQSQKVIDALQELVNCVVEEKHTIQIPEMGRYFRTKENKRQLTSIEMIHNVLLEIDDQLLYSVRISGGHSISVLQGDIGKHRVEAIINPVDRNLNPTAVIAKAIKRPGNAIEIFTFALTHFRVRLTRKQKLIASNAF